MRGRHIDLAVFADRLMQIAFFHVSTDRHAVGQRHRVRDKRKRRRAYLQRKKAALRASATRSTPGKQRPKKELGTTE
jgi:hypothetical protein